MTSKHSVSAFIDAVMAVEPNKLLDGKKPTRLLHVYFTNADSLWKDQLILLDLIYDDLELFKQHSTSPIDQFNTNVIVNKQLVHGAAILLWCTIQGAPFVIKCNLTMFADYYESLYAKHRMITVIEREAETFEKILDNPALSAICLKMHAHGNMTSYDGKVMYEVILIQQGGVDLCKGVLGLRLFDMRTANGESIPKSQADINYCKKLTTKSFEMLKILYENGISHGDAKADQLVWANVNGHEERSLDLRWLDMGQGYLKDNKLMATWNLRMMKDISEMLIVNAWSCGHMMLNGHYSEVNMKEIVKQFGTTTRIDGHLLEEYLIPDTGLVGVGPYMIDEFSTETVCRHFYPGKNLDYMEHINPMAFLDYLLEGDNLFDVIDRIFGLSRLVGKGTPSNVPGDEMIPKKYIQIRDPKAPPAQETPVQVSNVQSAPAQRPTLIPVQPIQQVKSLPTKIEALPLKDIHQNNLISQTGKPIYYSKNPFALYVDGTTYSNKSQIGPIEAWVFNNGVPVRANTGAYNCYFVITVEGNQAQLHMFEDTGAGLKPLWNFIMT